MRRLTSAQKTGSSAATVELSAGFDSDVVVVVCPQLLRNARAGPRGRKAYAITKAGRAELTKWIAAPTDYTLRHDPILKAGFFAGLSPRARAARAEADLAFFAEQLSILKGIERERRGSDEVDSRGDVRRMAIGFYSALADWCRGVLKDAGGEAD